MGRRQAGQADGGAASKVRLKNGRKHKIKCSSHSSSNNIIINIIMIIIVVVISSNNNALLLLSVDGLVHYLLLPLSLPRSIALSVHLSCSLGGQKYAKILRNYCDFYNFANTKQICWHAQSICLRAQTFAIVIKFVVLQHIPQALDSIYCVLLCMCRNCVCIVLDISAISKQMQMHSYRTVVCVMFWFSIEFTWLYFCWLPNGIGASVGVATVS